MASKVGGRRKSIANHEIKFEFQMGTNAAHATENQVLRRRAKERGRIRPASARFQQTGLSLNSGEQEDQFEKRGRTAFVSISNMMGGEGGPESREEGGSCAYEVG